MNSAARRFASRGYVVAVLVAILVGVLHRDALTTPWRDDRLLAGNPAWFQLAAPAWHAAIPGSMSMANGVTRMFDAVTDSSTTGDMRAVAALLTAVAAGGLVVIAQRLSVPTAVAVLLCIALTGSLLPVATTTSVAHATQKCAAAALLFAWSHLPAATWLRLIVLAAITVAGASNHASFVAFAAGIWTVEWHVAASAWRIRTAATAATASLCALLSAAWTIGTAIGSPSPIPVTGPGYLAIATALVSGRFNPEHQPWLQGSLSEAVAVSLPGPLILCAPLAIIALLPARTRRVAIASLLASVAVIIFTAGTWLPDPAVSGAVANIALVLLMGLGLSWLWDQPTRGARPLALVASASIGIGGFVGTAAASARAETAEMQAFVEAATEAVGHAWWSADRIATARAILLAAGSTTRETRVWAGVDAVRAISEDQPYVALSGIEGPLLRDGLWIVPRELAHPSATSFLSSQPDTRWLAVALRGGATGDFCRALLDRLGIAEPGSASGVSVLARLGAQPAVVSRNERLDISYGQALASLGDTAPARFQIDIDPVAKVTVNGEASAPIAQGMVVTLFDPWQIQSRSWAVGDCRRPSPPTIRDRRLKAADVFASHGERQLPATSIIGSTSIEVPLGESGNHWFGEGWHGPEAQAIRWTGAKDARLNVLMSYRQPVRIRLTAALAQRTAAPNSLSLSWNGTAISQPIASETVNAEWIIPKSLVRRGLNVFTVHVRELVSPAESGNSADTRLLGAAISHLSIEPLGNDRER